MRLEALLWAGVTVYFTVIATIYAAVGGSVGGVAILVVAAAFGGLVAGWSFHWSRHHEPRPEDRADAGAGDAQGEVGVFAASSLRPLGLGAGICIAVAGFPLGSWMVIAGTALLASQVGLLVRDQDA
jgi:hypothetical protein